VHVDSTILKLLKFSVHTAYVSIGYSAGSASSSSRSLLAPSARGKGNGQYGTGVRYDGEGERGGEGKGEREGKRVDRNTENCDYDNNNNNNDSNKNNSDNNNSSKVSKNKISEIFQDQNRDDTLLLFEEKKEKNTTKDIFTEISSIKLTKNTQKIDKDNSRSDSSLMKILETKNIRERKSVHLIPFLRNDFSPYASDLPPPLLLSHVLVSTVQHAVRSTDVYSNFLDYLFIILQHTFYQITYVNYLIIF
jgi:hypothetical protein